MNTNKRWLAGAALLVAIFVAGCSTPQSRIAKSPEVFARLTPQQQDMIKKNAARSGSTRRWSSLRSASPTT